MTDAEEMERARLFVEETSKKCHVKNTSAKTSIVSSRPPMMTTDGTLAIFEKLKAIHNELGLGELNGVKNYKSLYEFVADVFRE